MKFLSHLSPAAAVGLAAGFLVLLVTLILPPPGGMPVAGWRAAGLAAMMAIWWTTEPVPIAITSLLPLIVLPLGGISDIAGAAAPYANPLVFLFLGGFLLSAAIQRWGLHRRLAHAIIRAVGTDPRRIVLGFMLAVGFLSMWVSNTAAVVLMLPVAISVIAAIESCAGTEAHARRFALALLLGVAYASSIGGVGTLIGTPPNALLAGYLWQQHRIDVSFALWSVAAIPLVLIFLPIAWLVLTRVVFPVSQEFCAAVSGSHFGREAEAHVPITSAEIRVGAVFVLAAGLWIARPLLNELPALKALSDSAVALFCASLLFVVPSGMAKDKGFLMNWREAQGIPWHVLLLFGGGLSLAHAFDVSGLALWLGEELSGFGQLPPFVFLVSVTGLVVTMTELASNTATVAALLPIANTIAEQSDLGPIAISTAIALAASCAFMLPVATPPNALVFATGHVTIGAMMRAGLLLNLLSVLLVPPAAIAFGALMGE